MMLNDIPILETSFNSGKFINVYSNKVNQIEGAVDPYEEHTVRKKVGYTLPQWRKLSPEDRALEIAHERISSMIEYKQSEADAKRIEQSGN